MKKTFSLVDQGKTMHVSHLPHGYVRFMIKSSLYIPDTFVAVLAEEDVMLLSRINSIAVLTAMGDEEEKVVRVKKVGFFKGRRITFFLSNEKVIEFQVNEQNVWFQLMEFLSKQEYGR